MKFSTVIRISFYLLPLISICTKAMEAEKLSPPKRKQASTSGTQTSAKRVALEITRDRQVPRLTVQEQISDLKKRVVLLERVLKIQNDLPVPSRPERRPLIAQSPLEHSSLDQVTVAQSPIEQPPVAQSLVERPIERSSVARAALESISSEGAQPKQAAFETPPNAQAKLLAREEAEGWFKQGRKYYMGDGVEKQYDTARELFTKAAEQYHSAWAQVNACNCLGNIYFLGHGVPRDSIKAIQYFEKVKGQNHNLRAQAFACARLGQIYYKGYGVPENLVKAYEFLKRAADQDLHPWSQAQACVYLGRDVPLWLWYKSRCYQGTHVIQNSRQPNS